MLNIQKTWFLLPLLLIIVGCSTTHPSRQDNLAAYPYRYDGFDFHIGWRSAQTPQGVLLDVVMKNVRFAQVEGLDVTVFLMDANGKEKAHASAFPLPRPFKLDEYLNFSLLLQPTALSAGDLLRFRIDYRPVEGDRNTYRWLTTFTVNAATGKRIVPPEETSREL